MNWTQEQVDYVYSLYLAGHRYQKICDMANDNPLFDKELTKNMIVGAVHQHRRISKCDKIPERVGLRRIDDEIILLCLSLKRKGRTFREISEISGLNPSTVKQRMQNVARDDMAYGRTDREYYAGWLFQK